MIVGRSLDLISYGQDVIVRGIVPVWVGDDDVKVPYIYSKSIPNF